MKNNNFIHLLIDGIFVSFTGTNKERTKKGIGLTIANVILLLGIWFGLSCFGFRPIFTGNISDRILTLSSHILIMIIGGIVLFCTAIPFLIYFFTQFLLIIGSIIGVAKHNESEGKPLTALLVNIFGFIIVIVVGLLLLL